MQEPLISIRPLESTEDIPYDLLLLADPNRAAIDSYLSESSIFVAEMAYEPVACYALFMHDASRAEIKNIAVASIHQGLGIGKLLLRHAMDEARKRGAEFLQIATGNTSVGPLYLYQKMGFEITEILSGYFTRHYPEPILENGQLCTDQVILTKTLS